MLEKTVQSLKTKKRSKKGFTLMEMLIVVAIIAILIAIAIPTFTSQLNKAREAVDTANLRSCKSEAVAQAMLDSTSGTYYGVAGSNGTLSIQKDTAPTTGYNQAVQGSIEKGSGVIKVVVKEDYSITSADWVAAGK